MTTNTRYKDIKTDNIDIRVGYNYIKSKYYVTNNKGNYTTTYRPNMEKIREVLEVFGVTTSQVTDAELISFKAEMELLTNIYYTWHDTGAYIHSLQFNNYKDYPLVIDCEKSSMHIGNSPLVFDLTVNESPKRVRVPHICNFYKNTVGLDIKEEDMLILYNLLMKWYSPTWYNQIKEQENETDPLTYSTVCVLSNFDDTSDATCYCNFNALGDNYDHKINRVQSTDSASGEVVLLNPIGDTLKVGDSVLIEGAGIDYSGEIYSADGIYTVGEISTEENTYGFRIAQNETLPLTYSFPYNTCYVRAANYSITEMSRTDQTITVSANPTKILVGDKIHVIGADVAGDYETISCDGVYTVRDVIVSGTTYTIKVQEQIPTDFTGTATLTKELFVGYIDKIETTTGTNPYSTITLTQEAQVTPKASSYIILYMKGDRIQIQAKSSGITSTEIPLISEVIGYTDYNAEDDMATLGKAEPSTTVSINVTSVVEKLEENFPIGEFIVDNFKQAQDYIKNAHITELPDSMEDNYNIGTVPDSMTISTLPDSEITTMSCLGLYSKNYDEEGNPI